ncbi:hypothetical protein WN51_04458 [Melipona quadrifasciata]|uniref:Uncharacterized protein n=1 Tax=Melipona quadrifasciata TaxID=166423 RepID=A0A0M8ZUM3_9HYME|nr:hypothetical protein WN51_04458 [Melipona quadrifasciata]
MIAFLEVALRLQSAQILPLDSWRAFSAPGSPDAATSATSKLIISGGAFQTSGDITTYPGIATTYHLLADTFCHLSGRCRTSRSEKEVNARNSVSLDKELGQEPMRRVVTPISVTDSSMGPYNAELCHLSPIEDSLAAELVGAKSERGKKQIVLKNYESLVNWKDDVGRKTDCSFYVVEYR